MDVTETQSQFVNTTAAQPAAAEDDDDITSDFDTFLRMLTTQLENQDPLEPEEDTDFAVDLATFSTVEQVAKTNEILEGWTETQTFSGLAEVADLVGMEARAPVAAKWDGTPITLYPDMPSNADQATLIIRDADGNEVSRAAITVSNEPVDWTLRDQDGAVLPEGYYSFEVETRDDGELLDTQAVEVFARISEAQLHNGSPVMVFASGDIRAVDDVGAIRMPEG